MHRRIGAWGRRFATGLPRNHPLASLDQLSLLGAYPVNERVVHDRNLITGAGVTSGIDFALCVVADLYGATLAQEIQLQLEYDPAPPFNAGSPRTVSPAVLQAVNDKQAAFIATRRQATLRAAANLQHQQCVNLSQAGWDHQC